MKKIILILILPFFIFSKPISVKNINIILENIFEQHIQYKELDEVLIKRALKSYINQADPLKIYFTEDEIESYMNLSDITARKILNQIKKNDYTVFYNLNKLVQSSIERFRDNRFLIMKEILEKNNINQISLKHSAFAKNQNLLFQRQKAHVNAFYQSQKKRSKIDTEEKEKKIFALLHKKLKRNEDKFLIDNEEFTKEKRDDLLATYILKAISKSLDAHTNYFSEDEAYEMRLDIENEFEGVGLVLTETIDGVVVADLINNSPAKNSNLIKEGDIITEINGESTLGLGFDKVMKMMKGNNNNEVMLGLKRYDNEDSSFWTVKLEKKPISMDDQKLIASYELYTDGIIGKIELKSFYENSNGVSAEKDIKNAINDFRKKGKLKGLILDLRDNSGGFLSQAIRVAGIFMKNGVIVISKNSNNEMRYLRSIAPKAFYNGPLIVLTSKISASASEIVAAALQDYGVALIVGDKTTFGKGSIQYQTVTDKKAEYFYKVTIGKYYTVSGKTTQIEGVQADIDMPSNYFPYTVGERYLEYPLKADQINDAYNDNLSDLDSNIRGWFKQNYLPNLQKKVTFWQNLKSKLIENSQTRLSNNKEFQNFLKHQVKIKARLDGEDIELENKTFEDLQMQESVNILKDMIMMESSLKKAS